MILLLSSTVATSKNDAIELKDYYADCEFHSNDGTIMKQLCISALFSATSFQLDKINASFIEHNLCELNDMNVQDFENKIGIVKRGECSFDHKTQLAIKLQMKGLIIINSQPDIFPMGGPNNDNKYNIPIAMVGNNPKLLAFLESYKGNSNHFITLRKGID